MRLITAIAAGVGLFLSLKNNKPKTATNTNTGTNTNPKPNTNTGTNPKPGTTTTTTTTTTTPNVLPNVPSGNNTGNNVIPNAVTSPDTNVDTVPNVKTNDFDFIVKDEKRQVDFHFGPDNIYTCPVRYPDYSTTNPNYVDTDIYLEMIPENDTDNVLNQGFAYYFDAPASEHLKTDVDGNYFATPDQIARPYSRRYFRQSSNSLPDLSNAPIAVMMRIKGYPPVKKIRDNVYLAIVDGKEVLYNQFGGEYSDIKNHPNRVNDSDYMLHGRWDDPDLLGEWIQWEYRDEVPYNDDIPVLKNKHAYNLPDYGIITVYENKVNYIGSWCPTMDEFKDKIKWGVFGLEDGRHVRVIPKFRNWYLGEYGRLRLRKHWFKRINNYKEGDNYRGYLEWYGNE